MRISYLEEFRELERVSGDEGVISMIKSRHALCRKYSFAIPTEDAVNSVARLSPVVEMGAGTGYWASLLSGAGAEIHPFDIAPGLGNKYKFSASFCDVREGREGALRDFGEEYSLFLCWPNYNTDFAFNCLRHFRGRRLAYIGEEVGGCTANDAFFGLLAHGWTVTNRVVIPCWPGIHDQLVFYEKLS